MQVGQPFFKCGLALLRCAAEYWRTQWAAGARFLFLDFSQDPNGPTRRATCRASHTRTIHKTTTLPLTAATRQNSPNAGS